VPNFSDDVNALYPIRSGQGAADHASEFVIDFIITPAIKNVQCGHVIHRRGGFSAAAHRNQFFK
jgi:hypothetical protein